jgi:heterodisulfide reductase subunit B
MKYAYYPGCSLHSTAKEYDRSLRAVCERVGLELEEVKNWICCGSTPAHTTSRLLSLALPLKNLAEIEKSGFGEVITPCAACFSRFKIAWYEINNEPKLAAEVGEIIEHEFKDGVKVYHPLDILSRDAELSKLTDLVRNDLSGLKVVCYYGCLLTRPPKVTGFDDCEYPQSMDRIILALGVSALDWSYKTDCCGAAFALSRTDIVLKLSHDILEGAKAVGADAIIVACPMCQANLDTRQEEIEGKYQTTYRLPILYFTQLMGLAFAIPEEKLLLKRHLVDTEKVLEKVGQQCLTITK